MTPRKGHTAPRAKPLRATPSAPLRTLWTYTTSGDINREWRSYETRATFRLGRYQPNCDRPAAARVASQCAKEQTLPQRGLS